MNPTPVIAIFDIGKTNKKLFLFDENYHIVFERSVRLDEVVDEDGYPCEDLESLQQFVIGSLNEVTGLKEYDIKAVNFAAYGASLVYIGADGQIFTPLYNYLKPYPEELSQQFYAKHGGGEQFSIETASPVLGSLNSGLQLYRLKQEKPEIFKHLKYALHLPQYLSFLLTRNYYSDLTSIGCHTAMWDFGHDRYHDWIDSEGIASKLAPIVAADEVSEMIFGNGHFKVGPGLHDSSAALIPYLLNFNEPFILISTGTWNISLNPFNQSPLTADELKQDCLCYLQYQGKPVKASRLFSGFEHEQQVKRIAEHFKMDVVKFSDMAFQPKIIDQLKTNLPQDLDFASRELSDFKTALEAHHQLISDLIHSQVASTQLVLKGTLVKKIFVDGGFSKNEVFMNLLAAAFPQMEVYAASAAQASAVGAALVMHKEWNTRPIPKDMIELKRFAAKAI